MPSSTTKERLGSPQRVMRFFALIMGLVYAVLGGWLCYTAGQPTPVGAILPLGHTARLILGAVFVLYGMYRIVNTIRTQFRNSSSDELD